MDTLAFYNLSAEMRSILAALEESGGELTPDVEARLQALVEATDEKVEMFALAVRELERSALAIEQEEFRLRDRKRAKRAVKDRLREAIADHMVATGTEKVKTDLVTVSLVSGEERPKWLGKEERIPDEYKVVLTEYRLDVERVMADRAEGRSMPDDMRFQKLDYIRIT